MIIDPDVRGVSAHFGVDAALIQAVVQAEGNIVRAVQCSIPSVQTREQALQILCRSAVHAMSDYIRVRSRRARSWSSGNSAGRRSRWRTIRRI
jgi:hypothetical protein